MRSYDVKYDLGQEVYVISQRQIIRTIIDKIKIEHSTPWVNGNRNMEVMSGIEISYLVATEKRSNCTSYDWFKSEEVALKPEELIKDIK